MKVAKKGFYTKSPESRKYYFKIIRLGEIEKFTYFGIEVLENGNIVLIDDCLKSNRTKPIITYFIKTDLNEKVEYVNVRIE